MHPLNPKNVSPVKPSTSVSPAETKSRRTAPVIPGLSTLTEHGLIDFFAAGRYSEDPAETLNLVTPPGRPATKSETSAFLRRAADDQ